MQLDKIVFKGHIAKTGKRLVITVPESLRPAVGQYLGKDLKVSIEEAE